LPRSLRRQLDLLRAASGFRLLFVATLGSSVGTWMATIALTYDIQVRTHSAWWVSALWIATLVPTVVLGLAVGPLVDRLSRKRLLVMADVARLIVFVALPFVNSALSILILAGVAGIANSFFRPTVLAGLPNLVPEDDLARGTSLLQTADWAATALGPILAGAVIGASGPHIVYWINAATFLYSAVLILRIPAELLQSEQGITRGHWRDMREGIGEFARSRPLLTAFVALGFAVVASGFINVSEVFLATHSLHAHAFGYGLLWGASGAGLVVGSLVFGAFIDKHRPLAVYPFLFLPWALGALGAAVAPSIWFAAIAMVVCGFGNGLAFPLTVVIVQQNAPDRIRGRVFSVIISAHYAILGVAFALGGALTQNYGARWVYGGAAALIFCGSVSAAVLGGTRVSPRGQAARVDA
jgi:DHA3 family macrolide efflux protein-like MFS transporter